MTDHAELIAQLEDVREDYEKVGLHGENGVQIMANAIAALKASEARVKALEGEQDRLLYVLAGVAGAIDTGRNEPLAVWRDQIRIALDALKGGTQ